MKPGRIDHNRNLALRCGFCGDSENEHHAHLTINLRTGLYHCFRCGVKGKMPLSRHLELLTSLGEGLEILDLDEGIAHDAEELPELERGAGQMRATALDRYHSRFMGELWDAFRMRDLSGSDVGVHLRQAGHKSSSHGALGLGWSGEEPLISLPDDPVYVVEGPYDVLTPRYVCGFGFIGAHTLRRLKGHYAVIVPDGDVWTRPELMLRFANTIQSSLQPWWTGALVVGVEIIPSGKDPDEYPAEDRVRVPRSELYRFTLDLFRRCNVDQEIMRRKSNGKSPNHRRGSSRVR